MGLQSHSSNHICKNISGEENINNPNHIMNYFEYEEMAYFDEILGDNKSPSSIIDLESRAIIRE